MTVDTATRRFYAEIWPQAPMVLRVARILVKDSAEAEDLAQETLLKAFRFIDRLEAGSEVRKWLLAVLRNTRTDRLRAAGRQVPQSSLAGLDEQLPDSRPPAAAESADPREILEAFSDQQMIDALQDLPEEIRWTLLLVDVQGLDHASAAVVLDVPVGTIKSRAHRGRAMLRQVLQPSRKESQV